jgi:hypothetical protein
MRYAITTLTAAKVELEEELVMLDSLKGYYPNEGLRKLSIDSSKKRLEEIKEALELILSK